MSRLGKRSIDFSEHYDLEDDIYYVTFKTGEPSMVREIDDVLFLEVGIFTNMPTGFRILNFKKNKVTKIQFMRKQVSKLIKRAREKFTSASRLRGTTIEETIDKLLGR